MMNRPYDVANVAVGTEDEAVPEGLASNFAAYDERRRAFIQALEQELNDAMAWGPQPPGPAMSDSTDLTVAPSEADPGIQHGGQIDNGANWYDNDSFEIPNTTPNSIQYPDDDPETLPVRHRSVAFALPPTQQVLALPAPPRTSRSPSPSLPDDEITPSALPGPSRGRTPRRRVSPTPEVTEEVSEARKSLIESLSSAKSIVRESDKAAKEAKKELKLIRASMLADGVLVRGKHATAPRVAAYKLWLANGHPAASKPDFTQD
jgi:hypothetical protein